MGGSVAWWAESRQFPFNILQYLSQHLCSAVIQLFDRLQAHLQAENEGGCRLMQFPRSISPSLEERGGIVPVQFDCLSPVVWTHRNVPNR